MSSYVILSDGIIAQDALNVAHHCCLRWVRNLWSAS